MSRSQVAMTDLFMAILILMVLLVTFFIVWNIYQSRLADSIPRTEIELYALQFTNQLTRSPGVPDNWENNQIKRYSSDTLTRMLLHLDDVITQGGSGGGNGTKSHHETCSVSSECAAGAPVCCFVESHGGNVCEVSIHHSGVCASGITPDSSPNDNDGFLQTNYPTNSPILDSINQCKINQCLEFDGTDDYVVVEHDSSLSGLRNFTIEMWIYATEDQSSTEEHLIHKKNQWYIKLVRGMQSSFLINGVGQFFPNYTFNLNQWYHIALTNEHLTGATPKNNIKFYVDGNQIFSTTAVGTPADSTYKLFIGKQDSTSNYFAGRIDEIRISNTTRTEFNIVPEIDAIGLAEWDRIISEEKLQAFESLGYEQI